jgi:TolB protein
MVRSLVSEGDELWSAYTDGSKPTLILKMNASLSHPRYSPDGTKIVFSAFLLDKLNSEIFVVNADGTGLKQLTYDGADDESPTWSPDGTAIAWVTTRSTNAAIFRDERGRSQPAAAHHRLSNRVPGTGLQPRWA